ncbi:phage major capsid protein [Janibacter indicus]|uniref:Phage major capsid protein n=1 Tax=Janibacter indicus TaxID=857417 RepID=A0A7L9J4C5_9MICO|nr:phage major capsid protein [Janibacter indicus]QOK24149.1 phage major capsid protein [Janibacter indicus]
MNTKRDRLIEEGQAIINQAKAEDRDLTSDERAHVNSIFAELDSIDAAAKSAGLVDRLSNFPVKSAPEDETGFTPPTFTERKALEGSPWAKSVTASLSRAAAGVGVKALLQGEVAVPPAVEIVPLPDVPRTLLDLVARVPLESSHYSYLSQVEQTENAAVVADGAEKPVSVYKFAEVEGKAKVVAHLSEPFPLRYLEDYKGLGQVLDDEMRAGVLRAVESQLVTGDGTGENFTGLLTTTGTTAVPFATDVLTTVRTARSVMTAKGEQPNAWVMNPEDAAALELMRENGTTGGFLLTGDAYETLFGPGIARVPSTAIPKGTAILADWSKVRLYVRQAEHTLAATQAGELFAKNQVQLRSEGRYGIQVLRPQAVAVVDLTA